MVKEVVCALIVGQGKLLIAQHGIHSRHPWKWEFPGGKIQPGESPEEALGREIREELNMEIRVEERLAPVTHTYGEKVIRLIPFLCRWTGGDLQLTEHHAVRWVSPEGIARYDMLGADHILVEEGDNLERITKYAGRDGGQDSLFKGSTIVLNGSKVE